MRSLNQATGLLGVFVIVFYLQKKPSARQRTEGIRRDCSLSRLSTSEEQDRSRCLSGKLSGSCKVRLSIELTLALVRKSSVSWTCLSNSPSIEMILSILSETCGFCPSSLFAFA